MHKISSFFWGLVAGLLTGVAVAVLLLLVLLLPKLTITNRAALYATPTIWRHA